LLQFNIANRKKGKFYFLIDMIMTINFVKVYDNYTAYLN